MNISFFVSFVSQISACSSSDGEIASDYLRMALGPSFDLDSCKKAEQRPKLAQAKLELFEDFRAICKMNGIEPPAPPQDLLEAAMPQLTAEDRAIIESRSSAFMDQIGSGGGAVDDCLVIKRFVELCPWFVSQTDRVLVQAFLNLQLIQGGRDPLAPHSFRPGRGSLAERPARPINVLIVDDYINEIMSTFRAIAGWPEMTIDAQWVQTDYDTDQATILTGEAQKVVAAKPDIVLMDQGIGRINGPDLIGAIRKEDPETKIVFVGNTGGEPEKLNAAGAIGNLEKGRNTHPLTVAISRHF